MTLLVLETSVFKFFPQLLALPSCDSSRFFIHFPSFSILVKDLLLFLLEDVFQIF